MRTVSPNLYDWFTIVVTSYSSYIIVWQMRILQVWVTTTTPLGQRGGLPLFLPQPMEKAAWNICSDIPVTSKKRNLHSLKQDPFRWNLWRIFLKKKTTLWEFNSLRTGSHGPVEIVDVYLLKMVIFQFANCKRLPKWSHFLRIDIPSGKLSHNYGKSPFFMGKSTRNGDFL